jgi:large subunit ribosomal protein L15
MAKDKKVKPSTAFGEKRNKKSKSLKNNNLVPAPEGSTKEGKRVGRGTGSGMGKTSSRGSKGQKARASSMRRGFEGGQMPLHRRLPKRGFTSRNREEFQPVNLFQIEGKKLLGEVTPEILESVGLVKDATKKISILGTGELTSAFKITADKFSKVALEKIQSKGGSVQLRQPEVTNTEKAA